MNKWVPDAADSSHQFLTKVPEITAFFWIIKILTT